MRISFSVSSGTSGLTPVSLSNTLTVRIGGRDVIVLIDYCARAAI